MIGTFEESLSSRGVSMVRAAAADATDEIAALVEPPAVGVEPAVRGVALPDAVTTDPTPSELVTARTGVTGAGLAIAEYGSVVVTDAEDGSEHVSLYADTHVAVVAASDVVASMRDALDELGSCIRDGVTSAVVATGPSATADMGSLVEGAHGPTAVDVVVVTDR